jgi:predicted transcriptional regulator
MTPASAKQKILEAVELLPPDATIEDAIERLYFLAKVERGLADAEAGRLIPHDEVKRRLLG